MRVLSARRISDRLREADFNVQTVESWPGDESKTLITLPEETDRDELARVLDALAAGYEVDIGEAEPGVEVMLTEMG